MKEAINYGVIELTPALVFGLTGCETVKGMGQDIKNTDENIREQLR